MSEAQLERIKKSVKMASSNSKEAELEILLNILIKEVQRRKKLTDEAMPSSNSVSSIGSKQQHLKDAAHKVSHRFTGCQFPLPDKVENKAMVRLMNSLPPWVLRAKALVSILDKPEYRWLFEKVGAELIQNPIPIYELPDTPSSLMCIGPKLAPDKIKKLVELEFGVTTPK